MKREYIKYLIICVCAVILSTGPICMAYVHSPVEVDLRTYWILLAFTMLTLLEIVVTRRFFIPKLLEKGRYFAFALGVTLIAYLANVLAVWVEYLLRNLLGLPQLIEEPLSPFMWLESVPACMVGVFLVSGMVLWFLYDRQLLQSDRELEIKTELEEKTQAFKKRIRISGVAEMLEEAIAEIGKNPKEANRKIRILSDFLRQRLYDEDGRAEKIKTTETGERWENNTATDFILRKRYRKWRHLCLILVFAIISSALLFEYPSELIISSDNLVVSFIFFVVLTGLTYLNIYVVFPFFSKRGKVKFYGWILFATMTAIGFLMFSAAYKEEGIYNEYGVRVPDFVLVVSLVGNMLTFFFLFAGTASVVLLKENLEGKWRISRLEMETARIEFEYLQNQVNPHFIFNVLNNAGIMSYDEPEEAVATLQGLRSFLEYMLADSRRKTTTLGEEGDFLESYITMELSSGKSLDFCLELPERIRALKLPPLLLIPFVENSVKHLSTVDGMRWIRIIFREESGLIVFDCKNTADIGNKEKGGGLGIENTRRRLELIYGDEFSLRTGEKDRVYEVELKIPERK